MAIIRLPMFGMIAAALLMSCQPWYSQQGFEDRNAMRTEEGQLQLVEIAQRGGQDGERALYYLAIYDAAPEVYRPVMPQMIRALSRECTEASTVDEFELDPPACLRLEEVAVTFGAEAVPALETVNHYAAARALTAMGPSGRAGTDRAVSTLSSSFAPVRLQGIVAIQAVAMGTEAVLDILEQLERSDPNEEVRQAAGRARQVMVARSDEAPEVIPAPPRERPEVAQRVVAPRPNDIALVIGIEEYRGEIPPSQGARRDAEVFADLAESHLGLSRRNIIVLTDQQATRSSLEAYLEDWLPRNARPEGRVYVFFAGHGAPDPQTGEGYLVPWDGDPRFITRQGLHIDAMTAQLKELNAAEVVLMMDSCFSGSGGRSLLAEGTRPLVPVRPIATPEVSGETRFSLFAAAQADEVTGMTADGEHGLFSYYLFQGLRGAADRDGNGRVSAAELGIYLSEHVPDEARRENRDQTPFTQFLPEASGTMDLVIFADE